MVEDVMVVRTPYLELKELVMGYQGVVKTPCKYDKFDLARMVDSAYYNNEITGMQFIDLASWLR